MDAVSARPCVCAKLLCPVQLFVTPWTPPGSSVHGILQARILEWVAMPSSRGSSQPKDQTHDSCIGRQVLYNCTIWEAQDVTITNFQIYCTFLKFRWTLCVISKFIVQVRIAILNLVPSNSFACLLFLQPHPASVQSLPNAKMTAPKGEQSKRSTQRWRTITSASRDPDQKESRASAPRRGGERSHHQKESRASVPRGGGERSHQLRGDPAKGEQSKRSTRRWRTITSALRRSRSKGEQSKRSTRRWRTLTLVSR